jgi:hypothetical protein
MKQSIKKRTGGPTISAEERAARGQLHVQFRLDRVGAGQLSVVKTIGELPKDTFRRLLRDACAKISDKTRRPKKSTSQPK